MDDYSFRIRFTRSPRDTVNVDECSCQINSPKLPSPLVLTARDAEESIRNARTWTVRGSGWRTSKEAIEAGERCRDALMLALAELRIGADFGERTAKGVFTKAGLGMLEEGTGKRVLNDAHGLMTFETEPAPLFAQAGPLHAVRRVPGDRFLAAFETALRRPPELSERHRVALELFFASFFQNEADGRFLLLVLALEALIDPPPRSRAATAHVEHLMELTRNSTSLETEEKDSLLGSLGWLLCKSIRQTGKALVAERLGEAEYDGRAAPDFFAHCYNIRSRLVHADPPVPSRDEVSAAAGTLEVLVSDLLVSVLRSTSR